MRARYPYNNPQQSTQVNFEQIPISDRYRLNATKKLGRGAFGEIFLGMDIKQHEEVAIKLESKSIKSPHLLYEARIYQKLEGGEGIPNIHWWGTQGRYNVLVMDYLGPSLEDLFTFCGKKFSLKTTLMLAEQIFSRLEYIHSKNIIHRDVKPDNFVIGVGNKKHLLYVIDFGLSKRFRHSKTGIHIEYRDGKELTGTARYASISTHLGIEQSRRDDLESVGYIMVYFLKGSLPWQGLKAKNTEEKYEMIQNVKVNTPLTTLCKDLPQEIGDIINYTRGLAFDETPDYNKIKLTIKRLIEANEFKMDFLYDWVLKTNKEKKDKENKNENKDKDKEKDNNIIQDDKNNNIIQDDKDNNIIQNNNNNNNNVIGEEPYI